MKLNLETFMQTLAGGSGLLESVAARSLVVLMLILLAAALWRRGAAAARHLAWTTTFLCLLCLPVFVQFIPVWHSPTWISSAGFNNRLPDSVTFVSQKLIHLETKPSPAISENVGGAPVSIGNASSTVPVKRAVRWGGIGVAIWLAGMMLGSVRWLAVQIWLHQLNRRLRVCQDSDWLKLVENLRLDYQIKRPVKLLLADAAITPITWGFWKPAVILPAESRQWSSDRLHVVLRHELAHVKRWDCLTQEMAHAACLLYWFNPLVWLAAGRMRAEREKACDDFVLNTGARPAEYAGHLVEIARQFVGAPHLGGAVAMARPSGLEQRVTAILDGRRNRSRIANATVVGIVVSIFGLGLFVGSYAAENISQPWSLKKSKVAGQLKRFVAEKEAQESTLIGVDVIADEKDYAKQNFKLKAPDCQPFFAAAAQGDWLTVSNLLPELEKGVFHATETNHYPHGRWLQPVRETYGAIEAFVAGNGKYSEIFGDDVIQSIPPGSIYFGGTDPGRFIITALQKSHVKGEPFFTLTQNALADHKYLEFLRSMYGDENELEVQKIKSDLSVTQLKIAEAQKDGDSERRAAEVSDLELKAKVQRGTLEYFESTLEQARHESPPSVGRIYIPTPEDSQKCFQDYMTDARRRAKENTLKQGEQITENQGRVQVSGVVAVMEINGLLAKIIFDRNTNREFFIEESFPLDWMYPNLEPHGLIFKINRQPLAELSAAMVRKDRDYWQKLVPGMIGGWLKDDTSVQDVVSFADKVFLRHDLGGFTGDPRFVQNDYTSRMFSKLRSSIAGLYAWRVEHAANADEKERMAHAADFAFRQALALCPSSSEAVKRYTDFLKSRNRAADARLVTDMAERFNLKTASVFQMRLVLDAPSDDSEPMTLNYQNGSAANHRPAEMLNVQKTVLLDHTTLASAELVNDERGSPRIEITFTSEGQKQFAKVTREHHHQRLAIVIDGKLWSASMIESEITGGSGEISGSFSEDEAKAMTAKINAAVGK